jgi:hypothetical protein
VKRFLCILGALVVAEVALEVFWYEVWPPKIIGHINVPPGIDADMPNGGSVPVMGNSGFAAHYGAVAVVLAIVIVVVGLTVKRKPVEMG